MATTYKRGNEIPTIDVALVTMEVSGQENEIALDTASTIEVNPTSETEDAVQLIVKGRLIAQKPSNTTLKWLRFCRGVLLNTGLMQNIVLKPIQMPVLVLQVISPLLLGPLKRALSLSCMLIPVFIMRRVL